MQCELAFLYQENNTDMNASRAWTNLSNVAFCRWGNEISVRWGFVGSRQSSRDCLTWLISALPSFTPVTRCSSRVASAVVSSQPPSTQRGTHSGRYLGGGCGLHSRPLCLFLEENIYTALWLCLQTRSVLWLLNWTIVFPCGNCNGRDTHAGSLLELKGLFLVRGFGLPPAQKQAHFRGSYGREEGINWGWSISRGSFKIWVLINGPPNTRWGFLLLRFRDHYPNKWSIRIPWNYSVLFLSVIHKKETFRIVLNGL